jgi:hypothetical protein
MKFPVPKNQKARNETTENGLGGMQRSDSDDALGLSDSESES